MKRFYFLPENSKNNVFILVDNLESEINVLPGKVRPLRQKCPHPRALLCLLSPQSAQSAGTKTLQFSPNNVEIWLIFVDKKVKVLTASWKQKIIT